MTILTRHMSRIWLVALLAVLTACSGGGAGSSGAGGQNTGAIALSLTGLPAGLNGGVTLSGPGGFSQTILATRTVTNLASGTYTIAAANVLSGSSVYAPQPTTQAVDVSAGATANASVIYAATGALHLALQQVVAGLSAPVFLTAPAGDPRLFIVEQTGAIRIVQNGNVLPAAFLDITSRVSSGGERGLLSMAFDPRYSTNGFFFVYFTELNGDIAIERYQVSSGNPNVADPAPLRILTIGHPGFSNHNGGLVAFGPDGFLYIGTGDGGGTPANGQSLNTLLGKLLRIDVSNASASQPYAIPTLNPFFGQAGRRGEIWAYGLRNPWRYAFDAETASLYIADVGEARIEEINVAAAATAGLNYGWNITEGSLCYPSDPCDRQGLTLPVLEYAHAAGGACSITGGRVYRGSAIPELRGRYFYSDYCSGWLRSIVYSNGTAAEQVDWGIVNVGQILSFGEDAQGELYMLASPGQVYRIVRQ